MSIQTSVFVSLYNKNLPRFEFFCSTRTCGKTEKNERSPRRKLQRFAKVRVIEFASLGTHKLMRRFLPIKLTSADTESSQCP